MCPRAQRREPVPAARRATHDGARHAPAADARAASLLPRDRQRHLARPRAASRNDIVHVGLDVGAARRRGRFLRRVLKDVREQLGERRGATAPRPAPRSRSPRTLTVASTTGSPRDAAVVLAAPRDVGEHGVGLLICRYIASDTRSPGFTPG